MSAKTLLIVGTLLVALAAALTVVVLSGPTEDRSPVASTFSSGEEGCKALYLALEALQLPVERLRTDFTRLKDRKGVLVVVSPQRTSIRPREQERLKQWIEKGNRLVLFQAADRSAKQEEAAKPGREPRSVAGRSRQNDLGRMFGLSLLKIGDGSRESVSVSFPGIQDVKGISVSRSARWKDGPEGWRTIARDKDGPVVVEGKVGRGSVAAVSDPTLVSNRYLPLEHNMRLVLALLLGPARPAAILFDEHHHGYAVAESFWKFVGSSVFLWLIVQCLVGCGLFFFSRRASLAGRYRTITVERGRSTLEHVDSLGGIFESCKASSAALSALVERFVARLSRSIGARVPAMDDPAYGSADAGVPNAPPDLAVLLAECRAAIQGPDDPERSVVLARRLAEARASIESSRLSGHRRQAAFPRL